MSRRVQRGCQMLERATGVGNDFLLHVKSGRRSAGQCVPKGRHDPPFGWAGGSSARRSWKPRADRIFMLTVSEYLNQKYAMPNATMLTAKEAKILGIHWPLRRGWLSQFGSMEIHPSAASALIEALEEKEKKQPCKFQSRAISILRSAYGGRSVDPRSNEFLKSYEWRRARYIALKRSSGRCECCGHGPATGRVLNVDHIKPRKIFPEFALDQRNLQVLCDECNHGKGNWNCTDWRGT